MRRGGIAIVGGVAALAACFAKPGEPQGRAGDGGLGDGGVDAHVYRDSPSRGSSDAPVDGNQLRHVFVTMGTFHPVFANLNAADMACQAEAMAAALGTNWKAWIGDATEGGPAMRFTTNVGPYVQLDPSSTLVAADWPSLVGGSIANPIEYDAMGVLQGSGYVWTGVTAAGLADTGSAATVTSCNDWSDNTSGSARAGYAGSRNSSWTYNSLRPCSSMYRLYCFEQ